MSCIDGGGERLYESSIDFELTNGRILHIEQSKVPACYVFKGGGDWTFETDGTDMRNLRRVAK